MNVEMIRGNMFLPIQEFIDLPREVDAKNIMLIHCEFHDLLLKLTLKGY
ncbi:hypothetical protein [Serpentinicella alkaliphila]|uniref:Uncharacterized protein n=1 Tax=Serpentinicella alkaliphila TaxID=1734049 RepID=A0A4R2TJ01_9FIRM|nr:hypothetical protein [Serpentinicella alkaliphila]QUH26461.1 hypothetical protein HZR23_12510 [Serpentinicella alkaliphila]TCQ03261.1 hypothetical protein EDD79_101049 [Serpentinicella alkaliphila]